MLSPNVIVSHNLQRTSSEPDLCGDLGKRTVSNASVCSRTRAHAKHIHVTADDIAATRARSVSGMVAPVETKNISNDVAADALSNGETSSEVSSQAFDKLRQDLKQAQNELRSRDDQCRALSRVRDDVDQEIEELTASLFEEAHKMVYEANMGRAVAEKKLHESQLKLDGLQAEVGALKVLVITSTPSNPGKMSHKRAPSAGQICSDCETYHYISNEDYDWTVIDVLDKREVDPLVFPQFVSWVAQACPLKDHPFLSLIHKDDIIPSLRFSNEELAKSIYRSVQNNSLAIEPIKSKPRKCALTKTHGECPFRIQTGDSDEWYPVSASCRARIVAVVDFLTFLRYIRQGILKKDLNVMYWEMMKKRAEISLATLGLLKSNDRR